MEPQRKAELLARLKRARTGVQLNNLRRTLTPEERRELFYDESVSAVDRGAISLAANFAGTPPRNRWDCWSWDSAISDPETPILVQPKEDPDG